MARKSVRIPIEADASGVKRGVRDAEKSLDRLNSRAGTAFKTMGKAAAVGGVAVGAGLAVGLTKATKAAIEAEKSSARLDAQMRALGQNSPKVRKNIDDTVASLSKMSGFDDEDLQDAFTRIVRSTGNVKEALGPQGLQLAMDIARAKQIDVAKAAEIVAKAQDGQFMQLKRLGVEVKKGATAQEALAAATKAVAGQSEAYGQSTAGAMDKASVAWEGVLETVGAQVAPKLAEFLTWAANAMNEWGPKIQKVFDDIKPVVVDLWNRVMEKAREAMQWYRQNILPVLQAVQRFWNEHRADIMRVWNAIRTIIKTAIDNIRGVINAVMAILRGDWDRAWDEVKKIVGRTLRGVVTVIENLGPVILNAAKSIGISILKGVGEGAKELPGLIVALGKAVIREVPGAFKDVGAAVARAIYDGIKSVNFPTPSFTFANQRFGLGPLPDITVPYPSGIAWRARGGTIPGPAGAGDVVPAMLSPGEVVLNRRQQAMVGGARIMRALAATGGVVGAGRFAKGGVAAALSFAKAQLGEPYVWGGGHSFTDAHGWDCSGFASNVAARAGSSPIGTTMSLIRGRLPTGKEPIIYGFLGMNSSDPHRQHMGIRVNGQWYESSSSKGGVVGPGRSRTSWEAYRVPPGLENLRLTPEQVATLIPGRPVVGPGPKPPPPPRPKPVPGGSKPQLGAAPEERFGEDARDAPPELPPPPPTYESTGGAASDFARIQQRQWERAATFNRYASRLNREMWGGMMGAGTRGLFGGPEYVVAKLERLSGPGAASVVGRALSNGGYRTTSRTVLGV